MNGRTTAAWKRRKRNGESGQALAELAVALIALLAVFIGFLLIAALGTDSVHNLIAARESADQKFSSGVSGQAGKSIRSWDYGDDEIPFTMDDKAVVSPGGDGAYFIEQLTDNSGRLALQQGAASMDNNFASDISAANVFLNAAGLAEGNERTSDTLRTRGLDTLKPTIQWLFKQSDFSIEDSVFMPSSRSIVMEGN